MRGNGCSSILTRKKQWACSISRAMPQNLVFSSVLAGEVEGSWPILRGKRRWAHRVWSLASSGSPVEVCSGWMEVDGGN